MRMRADLYDTGRMGTCDQCLRAIRLGEHVFYYPGSRNLFCPDPGCGPRRHRSFRTFHQCGSERWTALAPTPFNSPGRQIRQSFVNRSGLP